MQIITVLRTCLSTLHDIDSILIPRQQCRRAGQLGMRSKYFWANLVRFGQN